MIIKRKLFTNAEGPKTKEVRKKTDKRDIALAGLYGAGTGAYLGSLMAINPAVLGTITGAATAGTAALTAAARRRNNIKGKNPHKPDELAYYKPEDDNKKSTKVARGVVIGGSAALGGAYGALSGGGRRVEAAKLANKVISNEGRRVKAHPKEAEAFRSWVGAMRSVHGPAADGKIVDAILESKAGRAAVNKKMIQKGALGAAGLGGYVALSELNSRKKKRALYDAWQEDKKNYKKDEDKKKKD